MKGEADATLSIVPSIPDELKHVMQALLLVTQFRKRRIYGERQRLAIARAALRKTPILILDGPAAGLDAANRALLNETLRQLTAKRTTFLITHDLNFDIEADRILKLVDGHLVEEEAA